MLVGNRMTSEPITVEPEDLLSRATHKMQAGGFRRLPVVSGGKLVGVGTFRDTLGDNPVCYLRLASKIPDQVAKALRDRGFKVLGVHRIAADFT